MPPPTVKGPPDWDHSYYALLWHTLHWQPILYNLRSLPDALSHTLNHVTYRSGPIPVTDFPGDPRFEFWWLRQRDIGGWAMAFFALLPIATATDAHPIRSASRPTDGVTAPSAHSRKTRLVAAVP